MDGDTLARRKAQLDIAERDRLEDVVAEMRERVQRTVRSQLRRMGLGDEPADAAALDDETRELLEAIDDASMDGHSWDEAFERYVAEVGYTIVTRLAALRCMEVRDFVDREVTVFRENGLTPAAETLVREENLWEDEAILAAYHHACDELAEEIAIPFDRGTTDGLVELDDDTFEALCGLLDRVPDAVWRADDVLGWVYQYYNRPSVDALDAKNSLDPGDVGPANQFYTPHWVVRMLVDNSLGKLYLEATGQESSVRAGADRSVEERTERLVTPDDAPGVPELCTYLIPDEDHQGAPPFDHPSELRVVDPACGSGHFLLYAFDVLERIWWAETDLDRGEIPAKVLEHNLYGVDIDLRSCQLAAFTLYLKARTRAEEEDGSFEMPHVGIVCADARVAEVQEAVDVFDQVTGEDTGVREAFDEIVDEFRSTEALGSLLDVRGTLAGAFGGEGSDVVDRGDDGPHTLDAFLTQLRGAVDERTSTSFGERDLRSFLTLLVVLTQEYDVALMNPPYGSGGRMPAGVREYVTDHYDHPPEYYINFVEACDRLVRPGGRIGMLVPRSFMFLKSFRAFREDFVGDEGSFDFLAELGIDVPDNATVRTAGTVVRSAVESAGEGTFIRLDDVDPSEKERAFLRAAFVDEQDGEITRRYQRDLSEFELVPGAPLTYWVPAHLRALYDSDTVLDGRNAGVNRDGLGDVRVGVQTGDDGRFTRAFWERPGPGWYPLANGGSDSWFLPRIDRTVLWEDGGREITRYHGSRPQNSQFYFRRGATFNRVKESGRRFGLLPEHSVFGDKGPTLFPEHDPWVLLSFTNSRLFTYLMLAQTTERMWEVGQVSKVPWRTDLESNDDLEDLSREAVGNLLSRRRYDFVSPHYDGPILLDVLGIDDPLPLYDHPHRELREELSVEEPPETVPPDASLEALGVAAATHLENVESSLQSCAEAIDDAVFDCFDVGGARRETVLQEIALRTSEDPRDREEYDPDAITEPTEDFPGMVKDLLLHLAIRTVHEADDGIVPLSDVEGEDTLLARIREEFERLFGDHASARLAEVDRVLGSESADDEAHPNLREWLDDDLFDYHVSTFDRTPILWRLTTDRLVSDPVGEGFACLLDYHRLDAGVLDRLRNRYLEPRKALLRERRHAADRRRGDDALSASGHAAAAEGYVRYESGLEQIAAFEERLGELARPSPREWSDENRQIARDAAGTAAAFRAETASRLEAFEALSGVDDVDVGELFSPSFSETVRANRDEWLDALDDLEAAFVAYAADGSDPVEAHHYDLFEYYDDLVGSPHYASNGILCTTYYFDDVETPDPVQVGDGGGISPRRRLLSELGSGLGTYRDLADELADACDAIASEIDPDWAERALSEITTAGYRPNRKHGVEINITPLAEAEIVPEIVGDRVI